MSGGLDWSQAAMRTTHTQGAGELPGPFSSLSQRGRSMSQQTQVPDLWASVRDHPPLGQVRSGGSPPSLEVEPWGCGGGCGSKGTATPSRPSRSTQQERADALPWIFEGLGQRGQKSAVKAEPYDLWAPLRQGGQGDTESCGCQDKAPRNRAQQQTGGHTVKIVSGDWLAEVMRLDAETAQQIVGQEVRLDTEAWGAVRSVLRTRMVVGAEQARAQQKRLAIWPDEAGKGAASELDGSGQSRAGGDARQYQYAQQVASQSGNETESTECCASDQFLMSASGFRFVDSEDGDDRNSGKMEITSGADYYRAILAPWKTLRRVEHWLRQLAARANAWDVCIEGAEVYLHRDRTWDGTEEVDGVGLDPSIKDYFDWHSDLPEGQAILEVRDFHATEASPLTLSSYSSVETRGGIPGVYEYEIETASTKGSATGVYAILSGSIPAPGADTYSAQYKDTRVGISFVNCCHVSTCHIYVRGFGTGIQVSGHSKHHLYTSVDLARHAYCGLTVLVGKDAVQYGLLEVDYGDQGSVDALAGRIADIVGNGDYPEYIVVSNCYFWSIGYDTAGADLTLGFLAQNCTVSANVFIGDAIRGLDGVELVGASSGHLIDGNTIYSHGKFCRLTKDNTEGLTHTYQAEIRPEATVDGGYLLLHPCSDEVGSGSVDVQSTDYGYSQRWFNTRLYDHDILDTYPYDVNDGNTLSAFGENGIALKAARCRTGTENTTIVISNNTIYGNHHFAGITVYEGSQGVRIYGNRIFQNSIGIAVSNTANDGWFSDADTDNYKVKTQDIYVYSNKIYMNEEDGIYIGSDCADVKRGADAGAVAGWVFQVADVYVYSNIIAHNLWSGVRVNNNAGAAGDVDHVALFGNLIIRNARGMRTDYPWNAKTVQVSWEGEMYVDWSLVERIWRPPNGWADYNCYLAWNPDADDFATWSQVPESTDGLMPAIRAARSSGPRGTYFSVEDASANLRIEESSFQAASIYGLGFPHMVAIGLLRYEGSNGATLAEDCVKDPTLARSLATLEYTLTGEACQPLDHESIARILVSLDWPSAPSVDLPEVHPFPIPRSPRAMASLSEHEAG